MLLVASGLIIAQQQMRGAHHGCLVSPLYLSPAMPRSTFQDRAAELIEEEVDPTRTDTPCACWSEPPRRPMLMFGLRRANPITSIAVCQKTESYETRVQAV